MDSSYVSKTFVDKIQLCIDISGKSETNLFGIYEIQINCSDNHSLWFTVDIQGGRVLTGNASSNACQAECRCSIDSNDLMSVLNGQITCSEAYISGKLKVTGSAASAYKFVRFIMDSLSLVNSIEWPVATDGLKSDIIFELIKNRMLTDPSLIKQSSLRTPVIVEIKLTKMIDGVPSHIATWTLDTKSQPYGQVYRHGPVEPLKSDVMLTIDDENYVGILFGKVNPQRLFISGQMKVKGNIMILQRLQQFWMKMQTKESTPEYDIIKRLLLNTQLKAGLQSEMVFFTFLQRLADSKSAQGQIALNRIIGMIITKHKVDKVQWVLIYDSHGRLCDVQHNLLEDETNHQTASYLTIRMDDLCFTQIVLGPKNWPLSEALKTERVELSGDQSSMPLLIAMFNHDQTSNLDLARAKL